MRLLHRHRRHSSGWCSSRHSRNHSSTLGILPPSKSNAQWTPGISLLCFLDCQRIWKHGCNFSFLQVCNVDNNYFNFKKIRYVLTSHAYTQTFLLSFRTKSLQSPANVFVLNLAIADFLMMLSQGPFYIINVMRSKWWSFGVLSCELYGFTGGVFGVTAIMTMAAIGKKLFVCSTKCTHILNSD